MNDQKPMVSGQAGDGLVAILRRRWWIVALCAVLFPLASLAINSQREKVYAAEAVVLLNQTNLANLLTDTPDPSLRVDRDRQAKTQVEVAKIESISESTLKKLDITDISPGQLRENISISAEPGTDLLRFEVQDSDPARAELLAQEYARQYTAMRARVDSRALADARAEVSQRLERPGLGEELRDSLRSKEARLSTLLTLQTRNSQLIRTPSEAIAVSPTPRRDAALAFLLGIVVGCTLALVIDSRDRRMRDVDDIFGALGVPLVGRIAPATGSSAKSVALLTDPLSSEADGYRFVVSGLEPAAIADTRSLLVLSATDNEGRARAAANLAVAFARSGEHVLALDLNFHGRQMSQLFGADKGPGASELAVASVAWEGAAKQISLMQTHSNNGHGSRGALIGAGSLTLVTTGATPASAPDFVGSGAVTSLIERVSGSFDRVVIDAPGLLGASDGLLVSHSVDAVLAVASVRELNRDAVDEFGRLLDRVPAPVIGLISVDDPAPSKLLRRSSRKRPKQTAPQAEKYVGV